MEEVNKAFDDLIDNLGVKYKNYVAIILDCSGSMTSMKKEAIDMFNEQIKALRESKGNMETYVSLVTFGSIVDKSTIWCDDVDKVDELTESNYKPCGGTALFDAVGQTISKLQELPDSKDANTSFLFLIITDGEENSSCEYNAERISKLIKKVKRTKRWTFTYLGTHADLAKVKDTFCLSVGNTRGYDGVKGFADNVAFTASATINYMSNRARGVTGTDDYYNFKVPVAPANEEKARDTIIRLKNAMKKKE